MQPLSGFEFETPVLYALPVLCFTTFSGKNVRRKTHKTLNVFPSFFALNLNFFMTNSTDLIQLILSYLMLNLNYKSYITIHASDLLSGLFLPNEVIYVLLLLHNNTITSVFWALTWFAAIKCLCLITELYLLIKSVILF